MASFKWLLFFVLLCSKAIQSEASSWTAKVPSSVKGLSGSCVVIPCTYSYPDPSRTLTGFAGMWTDTEHQLIYHPVFSKILGQYQGRTELLGDVTRKNCSLKIDPLKDSDHGPFNFRVEIANYEKFSFRQNPVTITIMSDPDPVSLSVNEVAEGETVSASCSVSHSCLTSPPIFNWSLSGEKTYQHQELENGLWQESSTLTFQATKANHQKTIKCTVKYKGGKRQTKSSILNVKYAPVNVEAVYRGDLKEGETVQLKCSSDANPPASYEWYGASGAQLHHGKVYMLSNVSRHTEALYCTAINLLGQRKSNLVQLHVQHAPEIKTASSCSSEANMVKCVCIAESRPPSTVHFVLSDRVLPKAKIEKHGPVTIGTIQAEFGSSEFIHCLANNTQGSANITLHFPVNSKEQGVYIFIAIGVAVVSLILIIALGVKKWCGSRSTDSATTTHLSTIKMDEDVKQPQYAATKRKEKNYDDVDYPGIYSNEHVYGNMETDLDDAIYANV